MPDHEQHTTDLGPIFRLVYQSSAQIGSDGRDAELGAIFGVACRKNAGIGVTGALLAWQDAFVQVLEGDESTVRGLYAAIRTDPRHRDVVTLDADTVPARVFGRWSMARVGDGSGADIPLRMDDATNDAAAQDALRTGDPGQDTMLSLMREYAHLGVGPA